MASCLYGEIRPDLRWIADELEDNDFIYKAYSKGVQYNAEDKNGIVHSFYPTTGTVLLHKSNNRKDRKTITLKALTLYEFMDLLSSPERIQQYFN